MDESYTEDDLTQELIPCQNGEDEHHERLIQTEYQTIQPEAPYNYFGERGYADLYIRKSIEEALWDQVYEVKADLEKFKASEIARQVTRMVENFYKDPDRYMPDRHKFELTVIPTERNLEYIRRNGKILFSCVKNYSDLIFTFRHPANTDPVHLVTNKTRYPDFPDEAWAEHCKTNNEVWEAVSGVVEED